MPNIVNKSHPEGFTVCDNRGLRTKTISLKATGLWALIKSYPPDWEINIEHLTQQKTDGRGSIYAALNELIEAGLVTKTRKRVGGRFGKISYNFYDFPQIQSEQELSPHTGFPDTVLPDTVLPDTEKPTHIKDCNPLNTEFNNYLGSKQEGGDFEQWVRERVNDRPDVKYPEKLIKHILKQGESSPEWRIFQSETCNDLSEYELMYEELSRV